VLRDGQELTLCEKLCSRDLLKWQSSVVGDDAEQHVLHEARLDLMRCATNADSYAFGNSCHGRWTAWTTTRFVLDLLPATRSLLEHSKDAVSECLERRAKCLATTWSSQHYQLYVTSVKLPTLYACPILHSTDERQWLREVDVAHCKLEGRGGQWGCQRPRNQSRVAQMRAIPSLRQPYTRCILSHRKASPHALFDVMVLDGGGKTMNNLVDSVCDRDRELPGNKRNLTHIPDLG